MFNAPNINPFDPSIGDPTPETIPQDEIIRRAIANSQLMLRVAMPCQITQVLGNQKVNLQPLLRARYMDGTVVSIPEIQNVMVSMPRGQKFSIKYPLAIGDTGYAIFCDRSLDLWSNGNGGILDPQDSRSHQLQDAVFVPGLVPFSMQTTDETDDLVITSDEAELRMTQSGGFSFKNSSQELINNLVNLVQTLSTASTVAGGPFTPDVVEALNEIVENLQSLEG